MYYWGMFLDYFIEVGLHQGKTLDHHDNSQIGSREMTEKSDEKAKEAYVIVSFSTRQM